MHSPCDCPGCQKVEPVAETRTDRTELYAIALLFLVWAAQSYVFWRP